MKAKKTQKKRYKRKESGFVQYNQEIIGILVLTFGVLVSLSFYYKNSVGMFGRFIKELLLGFIGIPAYVLPVLIIVYAFFIIFKKNSRNFNLRVLYSIILIVIISSMIHTGFYSEKDYENLTPVRSIYKFYDSGLSLSGGGILGGLISAPFLMMFQVLGTIIILTTLSIIDIILLTNISIANFIRNIKGLFVKIFRKSVTTLKEAAERRKEDNKYEEEMEIVGDEDDLSLQFKPVSNVIDFKIEKTSRELKEKTGNKSGKVEKEDNQTEIEPIEFIMKDLKESTAVEINKIKEKAAAPKIEASINIYDGKKEAAQPPVSEKLIEKEVAQHNHIHNSEYNYPPFELLSENSADGQDLKALKSSALEGARKLEDTLKSFGVEAKVINISRGPAVTRYELQPSPGVKVSKIVNLSDDISLNLAASGVRIEAPIPGKAAIGIEVPNKEVTPVFLREVIESDEFSKFQSKLAFAVGKDISGENIVADIAKMPHLLIAGATGAGKSVCINSLIISLLYKASPDEVKLLMVDPKVVELGVYNGIPHLLIPVVTDPRKAAGALNWAVQEMVNRYKLFAEKGVRDIKGYNAMLRASGEMGGLPQIVIIIDELADLMMVAPNDVEDAICRLAQMARAAGMHLVIATQRPSVDVITGIIKANIPSRISFAVTSQVDSRTILDMAGAEKLLGKGDMLFYPVGEPKPIRVKGAFVTEKEVENVVEHIKSLGNAEYDENIIEEINSENVPEEKDPGDNDELLPQAIELVVESGQASVSLIQRKFKVGYARAARIIDQMEERGVVGGYEGSKPRQVLMTRLQWQEMQMANNQ
ncbi:MAG: DNA translocase FtsK [Clostridia bacterium]|nr:DNA translocase FtsK [Clostridia bacterium]